MAAKSEQADAHPRQKWFAQAARSQKGRKQSQIPKLQDNFVRRIDFGQGLQPSLPVPWGDISTAFYSTGIGNIVVYFRETSAASMSLWIGKLFKSLHTSPGDRSYCRATYTGCRQGPRNNTEKGQVCTIVATSGDASGRKFSARCTTEDAYDFAGYTALDIAIRIQNSEKSLGLCTPSEVFDADYILSVPGISRTPMMRSI